MLRMRLSSVFSVGLLVMSALLNQGCGSSDDSEGSGGGSGAGGSLVGGAGGAGSGGDTAAAGAGAGGTAGVGQPGAGLKDDYASYFPIGVAVSGWHLQEQPEILAQHFNHFTAENSMKAAPIHPQEDTWNTTEADAIAELARSRGDKMTGHTLLWHRQQPSWMFQGLTAEDEASIETLKGRLQAHINGMVERYADVVDNWDVVNEAISDDASKTWRDGDEGSRWYEIFGGPEYIYWAYKYTKDALEAREPGSSAGKLYYNDYNETQKIDRILEMVTWLREEHGMEIDGIGLQAHWRLDWPSTRELQDTIDKVVSAGLKVKISELDITVYNDYPAPDYAFEEAPEVPLTQELETAQAERYRSLFAMFRDNAAHITSVTLWGTSDDRTWLDTEPVTRNDHPLLFDEQHQPKDALDAIRDF